MMWLRGGHSASRTSCTLLAGQLHAHPSKLISSPPQIERKLTPPCLFPTFFFKEDKNFHSKLKHESNVANRQWKGTLGVANWLPSLRHYPLSRWLKGEQFLCVDTDPICQGASTKCWLTGSCQGSVEVTVQTLWFSLQKMGLPHSMD